MMLLIPYWAVVLPLTLISAYLLLVKSRVAKPKNVSEDRLEEQTVDFGSKTD